MTADTYSATLGFLTMGTGNDNNTWGTNANTSVFQIFEDAIANRITSAVSGGTLDLSGTPPPSGPSQVRYSSLIFTGVLTAPQIIKVPNLVKWWWVNNQTSGGFTLTIETPSASATAVIPQNSGWQCVQCDGSANVTVSPFNFSQIQMPDGSASVPAYSNVNEGNSGWYRHGTQDWRLSVGGVDQLQVTGSGASTPNVVNALNGSLQQQGTQVVPPGTELAYAGINLPAGFLWEQGQPVSRTTYPNLLAALRLTAVGNVTNGSPDITSLGFDPRNLGLEGAVLEGPGITGLTVVACGASTIAMSGNATSGSGSPQTCYVYPYGNGDGATTFNVPDRRGRVIAGRDNMGPAGSGAAGRLTVAGSGINGIELNASGGSQTETFTLLQANLPSVNFPVSGITLTNGAGAATANIGIGTGTPGTSLAVSNSNISNNFNISNPSATNVQITTNVSVNAQGSAASGGTSVPVTVETVQP